jgi:hypothetical protein
MRARVAALLALLVITLGGVACDQQAALDALVPKAELESAERLFDQLRMRDYAAVEAVFNPQTVQGSLRPQLEAMAATIPQEPPKDVRLIGANVNVFNGTRTVSLTLEYAFADRWLIANILFHGSGGRQIVDGMRVLPTRDSQAHFNRFTFEGKGIRHFAMLAATVAMPLVVIGTLVLVIRAPIGRKKWLWAIFVLVGGGQLSFNWTTGQFAWQTFMVNLMAAGYFKVLNGPLMLVCSVPVGAIVFLAKRGDLIRAHEPKPEPVGATDV